MSTMISAGSYLSADIVMRGRDLSSSAATAEVIGIILTVGAGSLLVALVEEEEKLASENVLLVTSRISGLWAITPEAFGVTMAVDMPEVASTERLVN